MVSENSVGGRSRDGVAVRQVPGDRSLGGRSGRGCPEVRRVKCAAASGERACAGNAGRSPGRKPRTGPRSRRRGEGGRPKLRGGAGRRWLMLPPSAAPHGSSHLTPASRPIGPMRGASGCAGRGRVSGLRAGAARSPARRSCRRRRRRRRACRWAERPGLRVSSFLPASRCR